MKILEENKNVVVYENDRGTEKSIIKPFVSFVRIDSNHNNAGYVVKIVMKNDTPNQNEYFDTYEEAEEFHEDLIYCLGEDKFFVYENAYEYKSAVKKYEAPVVNLDVNHSGDGYVLIFCLKDRTPAQPDTFDTKEEARQIRNQYFLSLIPTK